MNKTGLESKTVTSYPPNLLCQVKSVCVFLQGKERRDKSGMVRGFWMVDRFIIVSYFVCIIRSRIHVSDTSV